MVDTKSKSERKGDLDIEDARIGYQIAVDLWTYEGEQNWARFNVMLVANSVIIAVIGLAVTNQEPLPSISFGMSVVGLILCITWFLIMKRGFDYQNYYVMSAREIEERFLAHIVKTISRGGAFAEGQPVTIEIGGKPKDLQLSWWSRRARAVHISEIVILIFTTIYILALLEAVGVIPFA
jgi:hypothetical protein